MAMIFQNFCVMRRVNLLKATKSATMITAREMDPM